MACVWKGPPSHSPLPHEKDTIHFVVVVVVGVYVAHRDPDPNKTNKIDYIIHKYLYPSLLVPSYLYILQLNEQKYRMNFKILTNGYK